MSQKETKIELAKLLEEKAKRVHYNRIETLFPDEGPYRRELYPKHVEFMNAGKQYRQRAIIAGNRTGKTLMGAYEMTCHLTGIYPKWWRGRVFEDPVSAWVASIRNSDTKDIIQGELMGSPMDEGSGMIPKHLIVKSVRKPGLADAIETVYVRHITGGISKCTFKAYEQGRDGFQGTKQQVIWLDEEPRDHGIFTECLTRTMDDKNPGIIYCTFTPLYGLSETVLSFMPNGNVPVGGVSPETPYRYITQVSWEEVPHLNEEQKKEILASYSPFEREARSRGIPSLGSGALYPYFEEDISVDPFEIPIYWPRAFGLDVGWNRTAGVWGAMDPDSKRIYLYSEHYEGQAVPAVHASAIKARGDWITGAIDPRSDTRSQVDGTRLVDLYLAEGLNLFPADNSVEAGIYKVGQLLESGQLKVFKTLKNWFSEFRIYRRDEKGKIIKKNDHLMDATRYLIMSGMEYAEAVPDPDAKLYEGVSASGSDAVTGY